MPINDDLKILELPLGNPTRSITEKDYLSLETEIIKKISDFQSENGNDIKFWLSRATWEVKQSKEAIQDSNMLNILKFSFKNELFLAPDQWSEVYSKIIELVRKAAESSPIIHPISKRIDRVSFKQKLLKFLSISAHPILSGKGERLAQKMLLAGLPTDHFDHAQEQRRFYLRRVRMDGYLDLNRREEVEAQANRILVRLRVELDSGKYTTGRDFFKACLDHLEQLTTQISRDDEQLDPYLEGLMYEQADRCIHRFTKADI